MQADDERKTPFERIVTAEPALFGYRLFIMAICAYLSFIGTKILHTNDDLKEALQTFKYDVAVRLGTVEGRAEVLNSRVDALSNRITNTDHSVDLINARVIDLLRSTK